MPPTNTVNNQADRAVVLATLTVALSSGFLPGVKGEGTLLYEAIGFSAWDVLALVTSHTYVKEHIAALWLTFAFLNVIAFSIVAIPAWAVAWNQSPRVSASVSAGYAALHIAALFWLFPVTH
jgi:hypothetical protein